MKDVIWFVKVTLPVVLVLSLAGVLLVCVNHEQVNDVIYNKDIRTGICFAHAAGSYNNLTYVPCTEKVEQLLIKK